MLASLSAVSPAALWPAVSNLLALICYQRVLQTPLRCLLRIHRCGSHWVGEIGLAKCSKFFPTGVSISKDTNRNPTVTAVATTVTNAVIAAGIA